MGKKELKVWKNSLPFKQRLKLRKFVVKLDCIGANDGKD